MVSRVRALPVSSGASGATRSVRLTRADQEAAIWLFHNPWKDDPEGLIAQHQAGEMVTTNSAAFKGMEREVVVLGIDLRPDASRTDLERQIYTAATRARSKLVVVADPAQLRDAELYLLAALFKDSD